MDTVFKVRINVRPGDSGLHLLSKYNYQLHLHLLTKGLLEEKLYRHLKLRPQIQFVVAESLFSSVKSVEQQFS